jgi:hypothetical protein
MAIAKYKRRYIAELESVIAIAQRELAQLAADPEFNPSSSLRTAMKDAIDAGVRLETAMEIEENPNTTKKD